MVENLLPGNSHMRMVAPQVRGVFNYWIGRGICIIGWAVQRRPRWQQEWGGRAAATPRRCPAVNTGGSSCLILHPSLSQWLGGLGRRTWQAN